MDTNKITTVKIKTDTKSLLDKLKIIERESYDDVIKRLIQSSSKQQSQSNLNNKKILPEMTQDFKEEKAKLFQGFWGIKSNKKEAVEKEEKREDKKGEKGKARISSEFEYV